MTCIYISVATGYRINKILVCFTACDTSHWEGLVEQQFGWISCKTKPSIYARLYTRSYNKRSQKRPAYLQLINNSNTYILFHVPRNSCSGLTWSHHLKRVHVNRWYGLVWDRSCRFDDKSISSIEFPRASAVNKEARRLFVE